MIKEQALYMFLLMPTMVDSVSSAELMILPIKCWIKNNV